jgi:hypothetical protein
MSTVTPPYPYPVTNSDLIKIHKLAKHIEGGYFAQTAALASVPSTTALPAGLPEGANKALEGNSQVAWGEGIELLAGSSQPSTTDTPEGVKVDATQIYYLLTPDSYRGRMHFNLHAVDRCRWSSLT